MNIRPNDSRNVFVRINVYLLDVERRGVQQLFQCWHNDFDTSLLSEQASK